eukprot:Amastigsp_a351292_7.p5 type:complete len:114 gc:universal Amastigsp_a351292_7:491-150(-)
MRTRVRRSQCTSMFPRCTRSAASSSRSSSLESLQTSVCCSVLRGGRGATIGGSASRRCSGRSRHRSANGVSRRTASCSRSAKQRQSTGAHSRPRTTSSAAARRPRTRIRAPRS